jgi:hypothetical protein
MNVEEYDNKIKLLEQENIQLKNKLKTYTAPIRNKNYYEIHKDDIIQKTKEYKDNLSVEKKKEYARTAYLKKKDKINSLNEKKQNENI